MTLKFQQHLNEELLRSEKRRTIIIMFIFLFALCFRVLNSFFVTDEETMRIRSFSSVWLFPLVVILFELLSFLYIKKQIKSNRKKIPIHLQYINIACEILLPALVMLLVAKQYPGFDLLKSPAIYIYFIFIILSTLRLNFLLSFFTGFLASLIYVLFSVCIYHRFDSNDAARSIILLFGGVAAGLVAKQIRTGINNSAHEAEKRQRITNLFGQQVSKEVVEKMLEQDRKIESRLANVAVMFIDIRDFTKFASGKSPEEIVRYQNVFFTLVVNAVSKHGGIVNQFLGDGCMTTFGAPLALENPSQKAVSAALELLEQLEAARQAGLIIDTRIGIGIHTGEAITGNIGNADRQQYSITGNVVIMASRIEQLNKELQSQILVSEEVANHINKNVPSAVYHNISLKGFEDPLTVYKLA